MSLYVTMNRCGTSWFQTCLQSAIDIARGGDGAYAYSNGLFFPTKGMPYRKLDWRFPLGTLDTAIHREDGPTFGEQFYWHSHNPFSVLRNARLKKMRIVVQVRNILESLESEYFKAKGDPREQLSEEELLDFDWEKYLAQKIAFYNSWGEVLTWHGNILLLRYEEMKHSPVDTLREMMEFWGFDIPRESCEEGVRLASKEAMREHLPKDEWDANPRVSFRGENFRGILPKALHARIIDIIKQDLLYDLEYQYEYDTPYGFLYS